MTSKDEWSTGLDFSLGSNTAANKASDSPNVLFGKGCHMVGTFELEGQARISGNVEGEIISRDELIVEESGVVNAKIFGKRVKIFGRVKGDIQCEERIELHGGACVSGDLLSPILVIKEGVVFEGNCAMKSTGKSTSNASASKSGSLQSSVSRSSIAKTAGVAPKQQTVPQQESFVQEQLVGNTETE